MKPTETIICGGGDRSRLHLSSAILASGSGGFGGATSSSAASEVVSVVGGVSGVVCGALLGGASCSLSIDGTSEDDEDDDALLQR